MNRLIITLLLLFALCNTVNAVSEQSLFSDNFNDGSIADWYQDSGTWSAATLQLVGGTTNPAFVSHTVSGLTAGRSYRFYYKNDPNVGSLENNFYWFTDNNGAGNISGYNLTISSTAGTLKVFRNGVVQTLANVGSMTIGSMHDINITHTFDGNIQVFVDNSLRATVIDTNFNSGSRIMFGTDNTAGAGKFDDVNVFFIGDTNTAFKVVDEEVTSIGLQASMTINGNNWPVNQYGNFDVNADISFPATIVISETGYDSRTFYFDTNAGLYQYPRFGLRTSSEAKDISFTFFAPDETTKLTNRFIRVIKNNVNAGAGITSSNAIITYNLAPQDSGYNFLTYPVGIESGTPDYNYGSVSVVISQPKDEVTNSAISGTFNFVLGGVGQQEFNTGTFPNSSIVIIGNTTDAYNLRVQDVNASGAQYYARYYVVQATGDTTSISLQPYLLKITDGILVNIKVIDLPTNLTVQGVRVTLVRSIGSSTTTVEDQITDALGIAQVVMQSQIQYTGSVTSQNQDTNYFTGTLSPVTQSMTIVINYTSSTIDYTGKKIYISLNPSGPKIQAGTSPTTQVDFNISVNYDFNSFVVQALDNNIIRNQTSSSSNPFNSNFTLNLNNFDSNYVTLKIIVINTDSNTTFTHSYLIVGTINGGTSDLVNLNNEYSTTSIALFIIAIMIGFTILLGQSPLGYSEATVFPVAILGGMLFYLLLPSMSLYYMGGLLVAGASWMWVRSVR